MSYEKVFKEASTPQKFRNRTAALGTEYGALCALADKAAEWIRRDANTDGVRILMEGIEQIPKTKRVAAMRHIRGYFGETHNVTKNKEGNYVLKRKPNGGGKKKGELEEFPTWVTFNEYVTAKEKTKKETGSEYSALKEMDKTIKMLEKRADMAVKEGDQESAKLFADLVDQARNKYATIENNHKVAERNGILRAV